ncbi:twin-arginine translocase subunit TatC [bacterium]|nr:twin-arginine translocase subunit TatC [bacterium]MCI0606350.1 twin-arginine translocase subunit TatC [bacterium]
MTTLQEAETQEGQMTLWEHLEELRRRLIICVVALFAGFIVCWFYREAIFQVVQAPFLKFVAKGDKLSFISLTEPFFVYMKVSALAALIFTSPILISQLWLFIAPGLYRKERTYAIPFIFFSTIFFLAGCVFCYYYVFPFACRYFLEVGSQFKQDVRVNDYFSLFSKLTLAIGLIFEIPILAFFLAKFGIINHHFLLNKFKYAILICFVISAIITPTPDVVTQTFLAVPMLLLYLLSILIAWIFGRKYD